MKQLAELNGRLHEAEAAVKSIGAALKENIEWSGYGAEIYVICRRGVASQKAVSILNEAGTAGVNIRGGLQAWSAQVDSDFPFY